MLDLLALDPQIEVVGVSSFRETEPVGYIDQPRFLNAAAAIQTSPFGMTSSWRKTPSTFPSSKVARIRVRKIVPANETSS